MAVALLALFVALGGVGYAATQINGSQLANRSVGGKKLKKDTVTGAEADEATLGKVPAARHADGASKAANATRAGSSGYASIAGRLADRQFFNIGYFEQRGTTDTSGKQILVAGSLTLTARCTAAGVALDATTSRPDAELVMTGGGQTTVRKRDFNDTIEDVVPPSKGGEVTFEYRVNGVSATQPGTEVTSGRFGEYQDSDSRCVAFGHAEYTPISVHLR